MNLEADSPSFNRILLVDDNAANLEILYQSLEDEGYELLVAQSGQEALDITREAQPALILLDINMPGMDGFEFLEAATEKLGAELCPIVVMLTTSLNPKDEERAMSFSVVREFLSKPLTLRQLQALGALVGAKEPNMLGQ